MMRKDELIVDSFAGGGGASLGIKWATGREPDIAINHDREALALHALNHPNTRHVCEDVWHADLRTLVNRRKVGLLWASPDCKHFSRAKGKTPVNKEIRSLAWVVVRWASQVRPRQIMLENVQEFADWGPVVPQWRCACGWKGTEGQAVLKRTRPRCPRCDAKSIRRYIRKTDDLTPDPARKGVTFRLWCNRLRGLGYDVRHRSVNAADVGAPTNRRRLFLVARRDGQPIQWPEPTHGDPKKLDAAPLFSPLRPWRTAAECIDWSIPCPSIFEREKPLVENTLFRIAHGVRRFVLENPQPFIVPITHQGERRCHGLDEPLPTVTTAHRGEHALVTPYLVQRYGERAGQAPRAVPLDRPMGVVVPTANAGDLVAPILAKYHHAKGNESRCHRVDEPIATLDTQPRFAQVAAMLKHYGGVVGQRIDEPAGTVTSIDHHALLAANIVRMSHGEKQWNGADEPLPTVTSHGNKHGLVATNLIRFNFDDAGVPIDAPLPTITYFGHAALVYSFLIRYFGTAIGQSCTDPLFTITGHDRFGLVTVTIAGELYVLVDIGMRMLTPRELARAQGFPDSYILQGTKTKQVALIGNSVCPQCAEALVRANSLTEVCV